MREITYCGAAAERILVYEDRVRIKPKHSGCEIAQQRKCGNRIGRFAYVCENCARKNGLIW
jgi:hypothetical protein